MQHIIRKTDESVWVIRTVNKENDLSESEVKIIESGFPNKWLEIYEDAYGKTKIKRIGPNVLLKKYGVIPSCFC